MFKNKKKIGIILITTLVLIIIFFLGFKAYGNKEIGLNIEKHKYYVHQGTNFNLPEASVSNKNSDEINVEITIYKDGKEVESIDTSRVGDIYTIYYKGTKGFLSVRKKIKVEIIANENLLKFDLLGISNQWTNEDVTLTFVPNQDNIKEYCFNGSCTNSKEVKVVENGSYKAYIIDEYNNKSEEKIYNITNIDKISPEIKGVNKIIRNGKVYLAVTATDNTSGVKEYSFDNGKTYNSLSEINVTKNTTLKIKVKDNAGNESEVFTYNYVTTSIETPKENIVKDTTAPTFTLIKTPAAEWSNTNVLITINATDDLSGVKEYSFDDGVTWQTGNTKEFSQTTNIKVKVKDNEENISTAKELSIKIDKIEPVIIGIKNEEIYTKEVTFTIIEDNIATQVLKKDGTEIDFVNTVSEEGSYSIIITDKAGNIATVIFEIILFDNNLVIGSPLDWVVSEEMNSTGGYTLLEFKGDMENSTSVEVEEDYYNNDNISRMYLDFLEIEDTGEMPNKNAYTINIPNEVDGKIITEIGKGIFVGIFYDEVEEEDILINEIFLIKSVNIPEGIKKIGKIETSFENNPFENAVFLYLLNLSSIYLPSTLIEIGDCAFLISNLNSLTIPQSVEKIGYGAFVDNSLKSLIFIGMKNETSQLKSIGSLAFAYSELTSLVIPSSVEEINAGAFQSGQLTSLIFEGLDTNSSKLITIEEDAFADNNITSLIIPANVEKIGYGAFKKNSILNLTFTGIEDGSSKLKIIEEDAFADNNITSLIIPANVEKIEAQSFKNNLLNSLVFAGTSTDGFGEDTSSLVEIESYNHVFDVSNVDHIIYLPSLLTKIGRGSFNCDYRESTCTFYINQLAFPDAYDEFWAENYIVYILDGNGGYKCVKNCPLPEWEVSEEMNSTGGYTLLKFNGNLEDSESVEVDENYYNDANISLMYKSAVEISSSDEMANRNAYTINIPNEVDGKTITEIGPRLFTGIDCSVSYFKLIESNLRIRAINIPEGIKKIDKTLAEYSESDLMGSFIYNLNLTSVYLPSTLLEIGHTTFYKTNLSDIQIPKSVINIGYRAFFHFANFENIKFEGAEDGTSQLKTIGQEAFYFDLVQNSYPLDIVIPASVEFIGKKAFTRNNISSLTFMGTEDETSQLIEIGEASFAENKIKVLVIPASVEKIQNYAFWRNSITSLTFAGTSIDGSGNDTNSLIEIESFAFTSDCEGNIYLPASLLNLGRHVFNCSFTSTKCNFYVNNLAIPEAFDTNWAGDYARKYILDGNGGYKCIENCPVPEWDVSETLNSTGGYTLLKFNGNLNNSDYVTVEKKYYNDANINPYYFTLMGISGTDEMNNKNAYTVNIPNEVDGKQITELGEDLFYAREYDNRDRLVIIEPYLRIKSVIIPEGIQKISKISDETWEELYPSGTFFLTVNLTSIIFPSTLIEIGDQAFVASNINSNIIIPKSVVEIGKNVFSGTFTKNSIIFEGAEDGTSSLKIIGDLAFFSENNNPVSLSVTIPSSVEKIGEKAFFNNNITNLIIKGAEDGTSRLKFINYLAFYGNAFSTIAFPNSLEELGSNSFYRTAEQFNTPIYLPLSLNIVWDNAFVCDYRETTCTFYLEHTEVPTTFNSNWAGSYARKYVSDGVGGYTCIENCP